MDWISLLLGRNPQYKWNSTQKSLYLIAKWSQVLKFIAGVERNLCQI